MFKFWKSRAKPKEIGPYRPLESYVNVMPNGFDSSYSYYDATGGPGTALDALPDFKYFYDKAGNNETPTSMVGFRYGTGSYFDQEERENMEIIR